jgi:hypothetical protein
MKQITDASQLFVADVKRDQTVKFINFDLIRNFRNHFLINFVFQDMVFTKPTKYFNGEAEAFLLVPILQMLKQLMETSSEKTSSLGVFNDESVANTLMKLAQNAANFASVMDVAKSSYYAGRQFSESVLAERLQADWSMEKNLILKSSKPGSEPDASSIDWMKTLFGQQVSRKNIKALKEVEMVDWQTFCDVAMKSLGLGPGFYTEQRNIKPFVAQRSNLENMFYGINFPGFHDLSDADDAFYILALMYLDYCHVTSTPEIYQTVMRPEAPNTPQRMDAMATRSKRFMKYYAAMAIAPRFMSLYAKYLLMKDLNIVLSTWTDNELSDNKDMAYKMSSIEKLCKNIIPERFLKHDEDIIRWFKDFYGVALLLPSEYSNLANFKDLTVPKPDAYLVKAGDPVVQSVIYRDKVLSQKDLMNLCVTRDQFIDVMYQACITLNNTIEQIDKSVTTIQAWDEFAGFELPTIPAATEFGQVKFASPTVQLVVNDAVPRNKVDYVHSEKGGTSPKRTFMGNVDFIPILKELVFGTIKPNVWLSFLRMSSLGKRPSASYNPSDVRITFTNDHILYIGARPMAHYAEMPIPVDYLAYADPMCVDHTISGLLSILQTLPSPYKALSDYFSSAASQFDMQYNLSDLTTSFAAIGFWFKGGLTDGNKADDWEANWIRPACDFIYGVPTSVFYAKQMEEVSKAASYKNVGLIVKSSASDNEYTFVMHSYFPTLCEVFMHAQTFCDGFIADIPVLSTQVLDAIQNDNDRYDKNKFRGIVVDADPDGVTSKHYQWFKSTGWSKYTTFLPHLTFRVSSQSSALSDKIINDPDIMKQFCVMAYVNDKELRPISRSFMKSPLIYIEPDDLMVSRDSSLQIIKPKIADLTEELSKKAELLAKKAAPPRLNPDEVKEIDNNSRADKLRPGHDDGLHPNHSKPDSDPEEEKKRKILEMKGASEHTELNDKGEAIETEKKRPYIAPDVTKKPGKGDIVTSEEQGAPGSAQNEPGAPIEEKKKKKIRRKKGDGSIEELEVEADYKLGEGEEFVE